MSILAALALGLFLIVSALASTPALAPLASLPAGVPAHKVADGNDPPPPPEPTCHPCDPMPGGSPPFTASALRPRVVPDHMVRPLVRRG